MKQIFRAALVVFVLSIETMPFAHAQISEPSDASHIVSEMQDASSLRTVIRTIEKLGQNQTIAERLVVYAQIPPDILDVKERLETAARLIEISSDLPYADEFIYLTAIDANLKQSSINRLSKYRLQRVLRDRFVSSLEEWRLEVASNLIPRQLESEEILPAEQEKFERALADRTVNLAQALLSSMNESQRASLLKREKDWQRMTTIWQRGDMRDIRRARRQSIKQGIVSDARKSPAKLISHGTLAATYLGGVHAAAFLGAPDIAMAATLMSVLADVGTVFTAKGHVSTYAQMFNMENDTPEKILKIKETKEQRIEALQPLFSEISGFVGAGAQSLKCAVEVSPDASHD